MKLSVAYKLGLMLFFLSGISAAISVSCSSDGGDGASSISMKYDLDRSTSLVQNIAINDGGISSSQSAEGSGTNNIIQTAGNKEASVSSSIGSTGTLSSTVSSYASGGTVSVGQNMQAVGQSVSAVSGATGSGSASATSESGVLNGAMVSSQMVTAGVGTVNTLQASNIAGALGYTDGEAKFSDNVVKVTGGLNGIGRVSGSLMATASDGAIASGSFDVDSLESAGYSAAKSISADGEAYSFLSSDDQLASSVSASANGHVSSTQNLLANGYSQVYASCNSDDETSRDFAANGNELSGSVSVTAGSPAILQNSLEGDVQSASSNLVLVPGSWVWNGYGGYLDSNPFIINDAQGRRHVIVQGGDSGLYDNVNGNWYGLGGIITSDPYAVQDGQGRMHILARGGDEALWDNVFDTGSWLAGWHGLGGRITLDPSAVVEPVPNGFLKIAVRGSDGSLWMRDLNTQDMSGTWNSLGGYMKSSPYVLFDNQGKIQTLIRGGDNGLWVNTGFPTAGGYSHEWNSHGGVITSAPKPLLKPDNANYMDIFVRGSDGALWVDTFNTQSGMGNWYGLGGYISPTGSGSTIYEGNPEPVADSNGKIHVFVRGGDGALWDDVGSLNPFDNTRYYDWNSLGGYITSDPSAIADNLIKVAVRAGDGSLWVNTISP